MGVGLQRLLACFTLFGLGCSPPSDQCSDDAQCPEGMCIETACAFPDDGCASGWRFGEYSVAAVAGRCVESQEGTSTGSSSAADSVGSLESGSPSTMSAHGSSSSTSLPPVLSSGGSTSTGLVDTSSSMGSSGSSESTGSAPDPSLIAEYRCNDELTADASGNGHDGMCTACPEPAVGLNAGACAFDGNGLIVVPNDAAFEPEAVTLAAWINVETLPEGQLLSIVGVPVGEGTANAYQFGLNVLPTGVRLFSCYGSDGDQNCLNTPFELEGWTHVATTIGPEGTTNYVGGVLVGEANPLPLGYDMRDVLIGADIDSGVQAHGFVGLIDELKIFDRVLEPAEIAMLASL